MVSRVSTVHWQGSSLRRVSHWQQFCTSTTSLLHFRCQHFHRCSHSTRSNFRVAQFPRQSHFSTETSTSMRICGVIRKHFTSNFHVHVSSSTFSQYHCTLFIHSTLQFDPLLQKSTGNFKLQCPGCRRRWTGIFLRLTLFFLTATTVFSAYTVVVRLSSFPVRFSKPSLLGSETKLWPCRTSATNRVPVSRVDQFCAL